MEEMQTMEEMRAQVREHFESLASPPTGASSTLHNTPGKLAQ